MRRRSAPWVSQLWSARPVACDAGSSPLSARRGASRRCCWPSAMRSQARFAACTVRGELSGFARAASGHCYFTLKDADGGRDAALRDVPARRGAARTSRRATASRSSCAAGSRCTSRAASCSSSSSRCSARGAGALYEQFLRAEGQARGRRAVRRRAQARRCRRFRARVGIVTSLGGAALHDVLTALARRAPHVRGGRLSRRRCRAPTRRRRWPRALARAGARAARSTC